ncbi:MAG TPA: acetylxylan esterase, partial [bacterium]|nr:acetylxylan esterase [bacterium]
MKKIKNRKHVSICGFAALTALAVLFASISAHAAEASLAARFKYDDSKPLNSRWAGLQGNPYYNLYKVIYDSENGEKVPALYMEPKAAKRPFPCVILQHGYSGSKDNAKTMGGFDMAKAGYAVFAIDAQYHGERRKPG